MVYCIVCVMGPRKIFGPRAPQSLNPALPIGYDAYDASRKITCQFFRRSLVVVVSQSNRNCNHGLRLFTLTMY